MKNNSLTLSNKIITNDILVVLPKFIGDAINCTPALQLLKKLYPEQKIILFVRPYLAPIFERDSHYSVMIDERFHSEQPISMLAQAKKLKSANIQLAIIMRNSLSEALLCFLAKIPYRVGYAKNGRSPLLTHKLKLDINHHYIFRYCRLVNQPHNNPFSTMPSTALAYQPSKLITPQHGTKTIGVYFGGSNKGARHYPHKLALTTLIGLAKEVACQFYIFGDNQEIVDMQAIQNELHKADIDSQLLAGKTSIPTMIDAIAALDLMLTIDSGPMHIAAALNIPFVAIVGFGTSPWSVVEPKVNNKISLVANSEHLIENEIILAITPEKIISASKTLLS